jgi:hypothetical protein
VQRLVNILDTVQQLLYFRNARDCTFIGAAYPRETPMRFVYRDGGREDALLRAARHVHSENGSRSILDKRPSADKTAGEKQSGYRLECYED